VSVSQAEVMLGHMAPMAAERALERSGSDVRGPAGTDAPWGVFPTAGDDDWCVVTVRDDADWQALCRVIDRPDLAGDADLAARAGRVAARAGVDEALTGWLARHGAVEAMELLQAAGVPAGAMLRVAELPAFPYYEQRRVFLTTRHPQLAEDLVLENAPVRSLHLPDPPDRPAPLLGEHTEEIARDRLGLSPAEISALVEARVLQPARSPAHAT
jgi:crotonobetainyl-CoA:carnitine CoA-transferase CaiB-like acyl-CoA transferase